MGRGMKNETYCQPGAYWGWISADGPGELIAINTRLTGVEYRNILSDVLLPSVQAIYDDTPVLLVQDNSSVHKSRVVQEWIEENPQVTALPWPPKSPDLNPIENMWGIMCREWGNYELNNIRTIKLLNNHVFAAWGRLQRANTTERLVDSMPRRMQDVIDVRGAYTKY